MRIAICEKNFTDAEMIEECCRNYFKSSGGKCKIDRYTSTVEFVEKKKNYDVLFLAIAMPGMSGIELKEYMERMGAYNTYIIFQTGFEGYMPQAFGENVIGFLVKPICQENITDILSKVEKKLDGKVMFEQEGTIFCARDIIHIQSEDVYSLVRIRTGEELLIRKSLTAWEKELNMQGFYRIHRKHIINMDYIEEYETDFVIIGGEKFAVSERKRKEFQKVYAGYRAGWYVYDKNRAFTTRELQAGEK